MPVIEKTERNKAIYKDYLFYKEERKKYQLMNIPKKYRISYPRFRDIIKRTEKKIRDKKV